MLTGWIHTSAPLYNICFFQEYVIPTFLYIDANHLVVFTSKRLENEWTHTVGIPTLTHEHRHA